MVSKKDTATLEKNEFKTLSMRLSLALDAGEFGVWDFNTQSKSIILDERIFDIYGLDKTTPISYENWISTVHPEDRADLETSIENTILNKTRNTNVFRIIKPDQSIRYIQSSSAVVCDDSGEVIRLIGIDIDITEKKLLKQDLLLSNKRLTFLKDRFFYAIEGSNDGLWDLDLRTNEVFYSTRWKELLGYMDNELANNLSIWETMVHPDDLESTWVEINRLLASQDPQDQFNINFRMRHKEGHYVPILSRAKKVFDENDEGVRLVGTHVDMTEIKNLEKELEDSYKLLHKITDNIPGAIYQYRLYPDGKSSFPYLSKGIENVFGVSIEDALKDAHLIFEVIHQDDLEMVKTTIAKSAETMTEWNVKYRVVVPNKGISWLHLKSTPEKLEDGSILWNGVLQDITELYAIQDAYKKERDKNAHYLDTVEVLLVALDNNGRVTMLNRKGEELLGYKEEEILGKLWFEIGVLPKEIAVNVKIFFHELMYLKELPKKELEHYLITKSGEKIMFSFSTSFLFDENRKCLGMLSSGMDISQKVMAEEELAKQHKYLQTIIDGVNDPIMVIKEDYSVEVSNEILKKSLKDVSFADPQNPKCYEISHHRSTPCNGDHPCPLNDVLRTHEHTTVVHNHQTKDGENRFIELSASPLLIKIKTV